MALGPNMKKFIAERSAQLTVERGGSDPGDIAARILDGGFQQDLREASLWCKKAVEIVRLAAEPNPWKSATEEEICGWILEKLEIRKKEQELQRRK